MKLYVFYLISSEDIINTTEYPAVSSEYITISDSRSYVLYAYTPEKRVRNEFRSIRDMNIFYEKIIDITRKDFEEFCDNNGDFLLEYHVLKTQSIDNGFYKTDVSFILSTRKEIDLVVFNDENYIETLLNEKLPPTDVFMNVKSDIFCNKYSKVLSDVYKMDDILCLLYPCETPPWKTMEVDHVALYCTLFKNTYDEEGRNLLCVSGDFLQCQPIPRKKKYLKVYY